MPSCRNELSRQRMGGRSSTGILAEPGCLIPLHCNLGLEVFGVAGDRSNRKGAPMCAVETQARGGGPPNELIPHPRLDAALSRRFPVGLEGNCIRVPAGTQPPAQSGAASTVFVHREPFPPIDHRTVQQKPRSGRMDPLIHERPLTFERLLARSRPGNAEAEEAVKRHQSADHRRRPYKPTCRRRAW